MSAGQRDAGSIGKAPGTTRRLDRRLKVFQKVRFGDVRQPARGHLLNLSANGALMHSAVAPQRGAEITLSFADMERTSVVVWSTDQRFGVRFRARLDDGDLWKAVRFCA